MLTFCESAFVIVVDVGFLIVGVLHEQLVVVAQLELGLKRVHNGNRTVGLLDVDWNVKPNKYSL